MTIGTDDEPGHDERPGRTVDLDLNDCRCKRRQRCCGECLGCRPDGELSSLRSTIGRAENANYSDTSGGRDETDCDCCEESSP